MTTTQASVAEFQNGGKPVAGPIYIVDANGNPISSFGGGTQYTDGATAPTHPVGTEIVFNNAGTMTAVSNSNGLPINGSITATNPSVGTSGSAIPTSSTLIGGSDGTNLQQLLVESASHPNLRLALYNGANQLAIDSSGRLTLVPNQVVEIGDGTTPTQKMAIDASGRISILAINSALPAGTNVIGHIIVDSGAITATTNADTTIGGTTAPGKELLVAGKTNDGTPQYQPLPEGAGGRSVIIEGVGGGTAVPVSAASLPLPTGASTAAKQPALGTAGSASADVISVQGIASMTPLQDNITQFGGSNVVTGTGASGSGIPRVTVSNDSQVQDIVASSGGSTPYHNLSAASTNFTNVKAVACQLYGYVLSNTSAAAIFVKFYDKATAPGTGDTPKRTIQVPANGVVLQTIPKGLKFTTGFGWAATGAVSDSDNTAIAANCVIDFDLNS